MTKIINITTSLVRFILILLLLTSTINTNAQEIKTVDNKGTIKIIKNNQTKTSNTAPSNPIEGDVWFDTSSNPYTLKMWKKPDWISFQKKIINLKEIESTTLQGGLSLTLNNLTDEAIGIRIIYSPQIGNLIYRQMVYDIYKTGTTDYGYVQGIGGDFEGSSVFKTSYSFSKIKWATKKFTHQYAGYILQASNGTRTNELKNSVAGYIVQKIFEIR